MNGPFQVAIILHSNMIDGTPVFLRKKDSGNNLKIPDLLKVFTLFSPVLTCVCTPIGAIWPEAQKAGPVPSIT